MLWIYGQNLHACSFIFIGHEGLKLVQTVLGFLYVTHFRRYYDRAPSVRAAAIEVVQGQFQERVKDRGQVGVAVSGVIQETFYSISHHTENVDKYKDKWR